MYTFVFVISLLQILGRAPVEGALKRAHRDFQHAQFVLHHPNANGRNSFAVNADFKAFLSLLREQSQMCDTLHRSGVQACIVLIHPIPDGLYPVIEAFKHNIHIANIDPVHYALPRCVSERGGWKRTFNLDRGEEICNYIPPNMTVPGSYDSSSPAYERVTPPSVRVVDFTNPVGTLRLKNPTYKNRAPPLIDVGKSKIPDGAGMKRHMLMRESEKKRVRYEEDSVSGMLDNLIQTFNSPPVGIEVFGRFIHFLKNCREKNKIFPKKEFIRQASDVKGKMFQIQPRNETKESFRLTIGEYRFNRETAQYDLPYNYDNALTFGISIIVPKDTLLIPYNESHMKKGRWVEWEYYHRRKRFVAGFWNSHDFEVPLFMSFSEPIIL